MAKRSGAHFASSAAPKRWPKLLAAVGLLGLAAAALWWFVLRPQAPDLQTKASEESSVSATTDTTTTASGAEEAEAPEPGSLAARFASGEISSVRLVGDSITAGFGTDGYVDPYLEQTTALIYDNGAGMVRYETSTQAVCWANAFRVWAQEHGVENFVNAGINGAFMMELAQDPDAWIREGADLIVVALGTNDVGYYGPEEYREAARTALAAAAQKAKVVVAVSPVSDLRPEYTLVEPAASLGEILREVCEEGGYLFVDASAAVAPEQFCADGLHPNSEGSLAIWSCLQSSLGLA